MAQRDGAALRADAEPTVVTVPVVAETFEVGAREVETGRVAVRAAVDTVVEVARATLTDTVVEVERVAVGRVVAEAPEPRWEGDTYVLPVVEEVAVIETRLVLREEVRVTRRAVTREHAQPVELRRTRVEIDRQSIPQGENA